MENRCWGRSKQSQAFTSLSATAAPRLDSSPASYLPTRSSAATRTPCLRVFGPTVSTDNRSYRPLCGESAPSLGGVTLRRRQDKSAECDRKASILLGGFRQSI